MSINEKIDLTTVERVDVFVDLLESSKAALFNSRLRKIASMANSPEAARKSAIKLVFSRRAAQATKLVAVALRDFDSIEVRGAIKFLESNSFDFTFLRKHLKEKLTLSKSDAAFPKDANDNNRKDDRGG
jgi:hypothetical protein